MQERSMSRRTFLAATASAAAATQVQAQPEAAAGRPNILHIMVDQMQAAVIARRSPCRTPNIDRLAAGGMLFERSYTPSSVCCPARAMLISGAYHWHNGVYNQVHSSPSVHRSMFPDVVTYSARLRDAGYRQGYVGKWHADYTRTPLDFGFDEIAAPNSYNPRVLRGINANPDGVTPPAANALRSVVTRSVRWPGSEEFPMWGHQIGPEEQTNPWHIAECGVRMLRRYASGNRPWHLEVHFPEPHDPYMPLKEYLDHYKPDDIPVPGNFRDDFRGKPGMHRREAESWGSMSEVDVRQGRAHYYAYCEQVDTQIGRILDALEQSGQSGSTLVAFTADHGDLAGGHRMWLKGWMPYEESYRIPLVVRWPGHVGTGRKTDKLVSSHDLAHTYVQAAGAQPLPFADGSSLLPLLENPDRSDWRDQLMCAFYGGEFVYTQRIAITHRFKYVFNGFDWDEMYDLEKDPYELHNVVDDAAYRSDVGDMRARLYEMMKSFGDPYGDPSTNLSADQRDGAAPNRYGAPRYLPRGARKNAS
jgi:arylsulfatase A-like enzyme